MVRFATLLPTVLALALVLKTAAPVLDATQSARPVAQELARFAPNAPLCVGDVSRTLVFGLAFYRNQPVHSFAEPTWKLPPNCLLVAPLAQTKNLIAAHYTFAGSFPAQEVGFWWVNGQPPLTPQVNH